MADLKQESNQIAQEKRKLRAKERLQSLSGGDITRGLGGNKSTIGDTYSTQKAREKVEAKTKATPKTRSSIKKTSSKSLEEKTTKKTAVNATVFSDDVLLEEKTKRRTKKQIGNLVVDESALENVSTVTAQRRTKRNALIISILIVGIVICWAVVLFSVIIKPRKPIYNTYLSLGGNASSECRLTTNGKQLEKWEAPPGIAQGIEYKDLKIELNVNKAGTFSVRFRVEILLDETVIDNATTVETLSNYILTTDSEGTEWYVYENLESPTTVLILNSITINQDYVNPLLSELNDKNATINIYVEINS